MTVNVAHGLCRMTAAKRLRQSPSTTIPYSSRAIFSSSGRAKYSR